jgi:hypothetical protein
MTPDAAGCQKIDRNPKRPWGLRFILANVMRRPPATTLLGAITSAGALALLVPSCSRPPPVSADQGPPQPIVEYVTQQEILTPLPLRVRLPARYGAESVIVLYQTWGSRDWSMMELERAGQSWSGAVTCREVSTVTGNTRYFFLALNAEGQVVVGSGSPEWPHVATIVSSLPGGPQALPHEPEPVRCHDVADCPPDFPGCPAYALLRPPCSSDVDCQNGDRCAWDGYCGAPTSAEVSAPNVEDADTDEARLAAAVRAATRRYKMAAGKPRTVIR